VSQFIRSAIDGVRELSCRGGETVRRGVRHRLLASIETIVQTRGVSFMDMLITLLPIIFRAINIAPQIQQAIHTGTSTVKAVEDNAGNLLPLLEQIGKLMFPGIKDSLAPAAAASTMFDPSTVKWVQTALNVLHIATPPLDVDGEYGPLTTDAVKNFQGANGMVVDGWAGDKTQEKLQQAVAGH
jgi:murein L,D-transpeptidase YcbB/YkuD